MKSGDTFKPCSQKVCNLLKQTDIQLQDIFTGQSDKGYYKSKFRLLCEARHRVAVDRENI